MLEHKPRKLRPINASETTEEERIEAKVKIRVA
jgi:hypothetical protein